MPEVEHHEDTIKRILAERLEVPLEQIELTSNIIEDLGADSFDILVIVSRVETHFDIQVPDQALEQLRTVGDIVTALQSVDSD